MFLLYNAALYSSILKLKNLHDLVTPEIIEQCKRKEQQAFKVMYDACLPYVFSIVKGYTDDGDWRKDLIQEIFAKLFLNIASFDVAKGDFKFWLRKIAVNQCLMFLRNKKNRPGFDGLENIALDPSQKETMNFDHLDPSLPEQVLPQMPNGFRQVFSLFILEDYSHNEVAQQLGISAETSRSQLARSKQWLRQYFFNHKNLINE
jgi:RNA polymerase sigma-70 factor (ECF subfamily)